MSFFGSIFKGIKAIGSFVGKNVLGIGNNNNNNQQYLPYSGIQTPPYYPTYPTEPLDINKWITLPNINVQPTTKTNMLLYVGIAVLAFLALRPRNK